MRISLTLDGLAILALFVGCGGSTVGSQPSIPPLTSITDVYAAGWEEGDATPPPPNNWGKIAFARVWKNGVPKTLSDPNNDASGYDVFVLVH